MLDHLWCTLHRANPAPRKLISCWGNDSQPWAMRDEGSRVQQSTAVGHVDYRHLAPLVIAALGIAKLPNVVSTKIGSCMTTGEEAPL